VKWLARLSDKRSQHLVFLAHVWVLAPFLVLWLGDRRVQTVVGQESMGQLRVVVALMVVYLVGRTFIAWRDRPKLRWEYVFPPIDTALITLILCVSHRGPMSNIALLYFLPIIAAAGALNVRWSALVGVMVVVGTIVSTAFGLGTPSNLAAESLRELWQEDALNVTFRLFFLVLVSSLVAFQAQIAALNQERLAVAADRSRIAADMHDGVQGHLITIASQLELIQKLANRDPARVAELARESREMARQGADELRFLVQRMRAPALADGFVPALRQYAHNICSRNGIELEFEVVGSGRPLEPDCEAALFRVAQEALNNVVKHAAANAVIVRLAFGVGGTSLLVVDNGCGFDSAAPHSGGLAGMSDRLEKLGGKLSLLSSPEQGTTLEAEV
jgi:signal transduction histidine kinase